MSDNVTKGADEKFCSSCGAIIKIAAEICPKCGVRQMAATSSGDPNASEKSKTVTLIFCIFLGFLGSHRFYTGKIGTGVIQLFICCFDFVLEIFVNPDSEDALMFTSITLIGLVIWIFIDFILILTSNFKDAYSKKVLNW